jgi:hypothetical protein
LEFNPTGLGALDRKYAIPFETCAPARVPMAINTAANIANIPNLEKNFMLMSKPMRFRT